MRIKSDIQSVSWSHRSVRMVKVRQGVGFQSFSRGYGGARARNHANLTLSTFTIKVGHRAVDPKPCVRGMCHPVQVVVSWSCELLWNNDGKLPIGFGAGRLRISKLRYFALPNSALNKEGHDILLPGLRLSSDRFYWWGLVSELQRSTREAFPRLRNTPDHRQFASSVNHWFLNKVGQQAVSPKIGDHSKKSSEKF